MYSSYTRSFIYLIIVILLIDVLVGLQSEHTYYTDKSTYVSFFLIKYERMFECMQNCETATVYFPFLLTSWKYV